MPDDFYRHRKTGHVYRVLALGFIEAGWVPAVFYYRYYAGARPVGAASDELRVIARPLAEWNEEVEVEGVKGPRFVLVG